MGANQIVACKWWVETPTTASNVSDNLNGAALTEGKYTRYHEQDNNHHPLPAALPCGGIAGAEVIKGR